MAQTAYLHTGRRAAYARHRSLLPLAKGAASPVEYLHHADARLLRGSAAKRTGPPRSGDVDFQGGTITIRQTKFYKTRILPRSEEHTSELQSLMRISYAVFCFTKK